MADKWIVGVAGSMRARVPVHGLNLADGGDGFERQFQKTSGKINPRSGSLESIQIVCAVARSSLCEPRNTRRGSGNKSLENHLIGIVRGAGPLFGRSHRPCQQRAARQIAGDPTARARAAR